MKELEDLKTSEMTNLGGGHFWAGIAVSLTATFLYEVLNDWDNNVQSFKAGFKSFK